MRSQLPYPGFLANLEANVEALSILIAVISPSIHILL